MTISHDALSKLLFSSEILVRDLLLGLSEGPWLHSLDFTTLEKVPSEFDQGQTKKDYVMASSAPSSLNFCGSISVLALVEKVFCV